MDATQAVTTSITQISQYAVGWGTLALIIAGIAQGLNRSGLGWFFLGLFLGPLALFFLVLGGKEAEPKKDS